jgi:hypothetical protein
MSAPVVNTDRLFKIQDAMKEDYSDIVLWASIIGFGMFLLFKYEDRRQSRRPHTGPK